MEHPTKKPLVPQPAPRPRGIIPNNDRQEKERAEQVRAIAEHSRRITEHKTRRIP